MPEKTRELQPPRGLGRLLFRLPIWIYRLKLGWLLGNRFLLLRHQGRKSGLARQTVLEVVRHDKETDIYVVVAAFGVKTDWYQNVLANPEVSIQVGRRRLDVVANLLAAEERGDLFVEFARKHPFEAKFVGVLGYTVDGSEADWHALGEQMLAVSFRPRTAG